VICVPLSLHCQTFKIRDPLEIPLVSNKQKSLFNLDLLRIVMVDKGRLMVLRKRTQEWLSGQYELPTFQMFTEDQSLNQYQTLDIELDYHYLPSFKSSITKYRINNFCLIVDSSDLKKLGIDHNKYEWLSPPFISSNLSTASFKTLKLFSIPIS
jgi:adenine-specific DNA glycosylase